MRYRVYCYGRVKDGRIVMLARKEFPNFELARRYADESRENGRWLYTRILNENFFGTQVEYK